jgi:3-oxoadipate enol-lactonase
MTIVEREVETHRGRVSFGTVGSGPDVVLLHSLLSNRNVFDRIVPLLSDRYTLHIVDLPGFGQTDLVEPSIDAYGSLIGAMMTEAGVSTDAVLLGNGLGGFVALGTAVNCGDRFDKLIIAGAGPGFPEEGKAPFKGMAAAAGENGMAGVVDVAVRRIFTEEYLDAHPDDLAERRAVLLRTDVTAFQRACEALWTLDYFEAVKHITNETLLVVGSEDSATPPSLVRQLHQLMPNTTYVELPGVAHGPQLQDPEGFVATLDAFLG